MPSYTIAYNVAVRVPGEMGGTYREERASFNTEAPVLAVIRDLGRRGAVYREPGDLLDLADRIVEASGQAHPGELQVSAAALLGSQDRVNAKRHTRSTP